MVGSDGSSKRTRAFDQAKRNVLEALSAGDKDRSKKGSLDAPIVELVELINVHPDFCTTSSCSGRIALFEDVDGAVCRKAGGTWLLSSHAPVDASAIHAALAGCQALGQAGGSVTLKQEPLVLHVECRDLAAAERLLRVSVGSGFRESGINLGKKRVLVGIRTGANKLEAPIVLGGQRLLTEPGVDALVALANAKFHLNAERTQRFEEALRAEFREEREKTEERMRHQGGGRGGEQEDDGAAGPSMKMMTTTARQAKRREKALARRREKEAAKRGRKARAAALADGGAPGLEWREASMPAAEGAEARQWLQRWGHSLSRVDGGKDGTAVTAWLFGGYGYAGAGRPAGRLNSLLELWLDPSASALAVEQIDDGGAGPLGVPGAREQHGAAVLFGLRGYEQQPTLVVFGGRASPIKPFGDLWRFDRGQGWASVVVAGGRPPCPRWAHSMTALPSHGGQGQGRARVVVYGGRDAEGVFGGRLHVLSLATGDAEQEEQWSWSEIALPSLPPLFLHTGSCLGESSGARLLLFGGMTDLTGRSVHGGGAIVSLEEGEEEESCTPVARDVGGRYAHAAAEMGGGEVWITGGIPAEPPPLSSSSSSSSKPLLPVLRFQIDGGGAEGTVVVARKEDASLVPRLAKPALLHHATVPYAISEGQAPRLLSVGGGVQTFAFSPVFAPPLCLGQPGPQAQNGAQEPQEQPRQQKQQKQRRKEEEKKDKAERPPTPTAPPCPCLLVMPAHVKRVKTALERVGLFGKQRRIAPSTTQPGLMAIPLELGDPSIAQELRAAVLEGVPPTSKRVAVVMDALASSSSDPIVHGWTDDTEAPPFSAAALQGQALRLRTALERVLVTHAGLSAVDAAAALSPAFLATLHVERLGGEVLLLEEDSPLLRPANEPWCSLQPQHLWPALLGLYPGATRVARMARVQDGPKRRSQVRLLYPPPDDAAARAEGPGSPGWVTVREKGLTYAFDVERCMFSSGNVSEKERIGCLDCRGETVLDLYAGIGYYTLPIAVHGKAARVVACEWNPDACLALCHNVAANGVGDRVEVLFGDNRLTTRALPDGMAHRVHLGLLPSSEEGWPIAARLLRPEGGWLHVHANVLESATEAWVARVEKEIRDLGLQLDRPWAKDGVTSRLVRVKSFAPRIWHLVLDVRCGGGGGGGGKGKGKGGRCRGQEVEGTTHVK